MKNGLIVDDNGTQKWYKNDYLHRENGPAVIWKSGDKEYRINGQLHREDGPAIEYTNVHMWYFNDKLHRIDGAAVIDFFEDSKEYWYKGKEVEDIKTDEDYNNFIKFKAFW